MAEVYRNIVKLINNFLSKTIMYKKAIQLKLRVNTFRGLLSVEQLWDLPKEEIGELAKRTRKHIADEKGVSGDSELDFLKPAAQQEETSDELTFRILKDIYMTKRAEEDKAHRRTAARENNRKILELIARKQDQELENKSIEELEAMLQEED